MKVLGNKTDVDNGIIKTDITSDESIKKTVDNIKQKFGRIDGDVDVNTSGGSITVDEVHGNIDASAGRVLNAIHHPVIKHLAVGGCFWGGERCFGSFGIGAVEVGITIAIAIGIRSANRNVDAAACAL